MQEKYRQEEHDNRPDYPVLYKAQSQDLKRRLVSAPTQEDIFKFVKDFEKAGFGKVESLKFSNHGNEILILWSGEFLFGYYFNGKEWLMFMDDLFDPNTLLIKFSSKTSENMISYHSKIKERGEIIITLKDLQPFYKGE